MNPTDIWYYAGEIESRAGRRGGPPPPAERPRAGRLRQVRRAIGFRLVAWGVALIGDTRPSRRPVTTTG